MGKEIESSYMYMYIHGICWRCVAIVNRRKLENC